MLPLGEWQLIGPSIADPTYLKICEGKQGRFWVTVAVLPAYYRPVAFANAEHGHVRVWKRFKGTVRCPSPHDLYADALDTLLNEGTEGKVGAIKDWSGHQLMPC